MGQLTSVRTSEVTRTKTVYVTIIIVNVCPVLVGDTTSRFSIVLPLSLRLTACPVYLPAGLTVA